MEITQTPGGKGVEHEFSIDTGNKILFRVEDFRKQSTGVHGKVFVGLDKRILNYTVLNLDRDEDRVRFVNSAFNMLPPVARETLDKGMLKHTFDLFCLHGYTEYVGTQKPAFMVPLPFRTPPNFLLDPFLIRGGGTILFGPPGRGKSYVAMTIAVAVDAGLTRLFNVQQGRVLFVNLERSEESIQRRLLNINLALEIDEAYPLLTLNARGKTLDDVIEAIDESINEHDVKLVVLDSISRAGFGDLNDNRPVNKIIDTLNNTCDTWLGLAHAPRGDSTHVYGSVHFDAGADIVIQQVSEAHEKSLGIGLNITKANDVGKKPMMVLGYEFDDIGLTKIWFPKASEFPELMLSRPVSTADEVHDYLSEVDKATAGEIAMSLGKSRSMISSILNSDDRYEAGQRGRERVFGIK